MSYSHPYIGKFSLNLIKISSDEFQKKNEGTNTNKTDARYLPCTISCPKCTRGFRSMHNLRRHACSKHGLNQNELTVAMKMAEGVKQVATLKRTSPETTTTTASTVPPTK